MKQLFILVLLFSTLLPIITSEKNNTIQTGFTSDLTDNFSRKQIGLLQQSNRLLTTAIITAVHGLSVTLLSIPVIYYTPYVGAYNSLYLTLGYVCSGIVSGTGLTLNIVSIIFFVVSAAVRHRHRKNTIAYAVRSEISVETGRFSVSLKLHLPF